jgi:putative polyhydroxyalkanoate system protein
MPKLSITIPHTLGRDHAAQRLNSFMERLKEKHQDQVGNLQEAWEGDTLKFSFTTFGFKISGAGTLSEDEVKMDIDLPFAAMMFKGKIESEIRETLTRILR